MSTRPQEQPVGGCPRSKLRSPELCQNVTPWFWYDPRGGFEKSPDSCSYFPQGQHGHTSGWKAVEGHGVSYPAVRTPLVMGDSVLSSPLSVHFLYCWLHSILSCHHCTYFPRSALPTAASGAHPWRRDYLLLCLGSPHSVQSLFSEL